MTKRIINLIIDSFRKSFEKKDFLIPSIRNFSSLMQNEASLFSYSEELKKYSNLREYFQENDEYRNIISKLIDSCILNIKTEIPEVSLEVTGRLKGFMSYFTKSLSLMIYDEPYKNLKDLLGVRFVISEETEEQEISSCYKIVRIILDYLSTDTNCKLINPTKPKNISNTPYLGILPKHSDLDEIANYSKFVKDYIRNVKVSGYRSLHILIWIPDIGQYLEIQVRGKKMDNFIKNNDGVDPSSYKSMKYSDPRVSNILKEIYNINIHTLEYETDDTYNRKYVLKNDVSTANTAIEFINFKT